jgi:hypothetical protein
LVRRCVRGRCFVTGNREGRVRRPRSSAAGSRARARAAAQQTVREAARKRMPLPSSSDADYAIGRIRSTVHGTDEVSAARALAASGGDVHQAISALLEAALPEDSVEILHYNEKSARLEGSLLSWEDTFSFDVLGWLVLPVGFDVDQVAELQEADGAAGAALIGQTLNGYVEELCGVGYRSNGPAHRAGDDDADGCDPLTGGNGIRALGRAYINMTGWNQVRSESDAGEVVPSLTRSGGRW